MQLVIELLQSKRWIVNTITRHSLLLPKESYKNQVDDERDGFLQQQVGV